MMSIMIDTPNGSVSGHWLAHADREIIKMEQDLYQPCSTEVVEGQHSAAQRSNKAVSGFIGESTTELDCEVSALCGCRLMADC